MEINALKLTGNSNSVKNLRTIFKIQFPNPTNNRILELATELEKLNIKLGAEEFQNDAIPFIINDDNLQELIKLEEDSSYIQELISNSKID